MKKLALVLVLVSSSASANWWDNPPIEENENPYYTNEVGDILNQRGQVVTPGPHTVQRRLGGDTRCYTYGSVRQCQHAASALGTKATCGTPAPLGRYGANPPGFWDGINDRKSYEKRLIRAFNSRAQSC